MKYLLQLVLVLSLAAATGYLARSRVASAGVAHAPALEASPDTRSLIEGGARPERPLTAGEAFSAIVAAHRGRDVFNLHYRTMVAAELIEPSQFGPLALLMAHEEDQEWPVLRIIVLLKWREIDQAAMLAFLEANPNVRPLAKSIPSLFRYWSLSDPKGAIAAAARLTGRLRSLAWSGLAALRGEPEYAALMDQHEQSKQSEVLGDLSEALSSRLWKTDRGAFYATLNANMRSDPRATLLAIAAMADSGDKFEALQIASSMSGADAFEGLRTLVELRDSGALPRADALYNLFGAFLRSAKPENAQEVVSFLSNNLNTQEILYAFSRSAPAIRDQSDFQTYYALASQLPTSQKRSQLIMQLFQGWASRDWRSASAWAVENLAPSDYEQQAPLLVSNAFHNGGAEVAKSLFANLPTNSAKASAIQNLANTWGGQDPLGFAEWSMTLEDDRLAVQGLKQLAHQWHSRDSEGFMLFTETLPEGDLKSHYQKTIGRSLAHSDPFRAIDYAATRMEPQAALEITSQALTVYGHREPKAALDLAVSSLGDQPQLTHIVSAVASNWASYDRTAALSYFDRSENSALRETAVPSIVSLWANQDPKEAIDYTLNLPADAVRDKIALSLIYQHQRYPGGDQQIDALAASITDPNMKQQAEQARSRARSNPLYITR